MILYFKIIIAALISFLCLVVVTFPITLKFIKKYKIELNKVIVGYSLILYFISVFFLVVFPAPSEDALIEYQEIKLQPGAFIWEFIEKTSFKFDEPTTYLKALMEPCFYTVVFNVLMLMPFGVFMCYFHRSFVNTLIYTFILSFFLEFTQLTGIFGIYDVAYRIFDVDDLILNTIGGVCGFIIADVFMKKFWSR